MVDVQFLHPRCTMDHVGMIPEWLNEHDPRPAKDQLNSAYGHGGGWRPFNGFKLNDKNGLEYPDDPTHYPIAEMHLRDETIFIYDHAWVAIIQPDRSFEVCRMD